MSIFGKIMDQIFHGGKKPEANLQPVDHPSAAPRSSTPVSPTAAPVPAPAAASPQPVATAPVDVGAVLASMADIKGGGGNYQSSIVDLLKLLDLDSSLSARKELADELGVDAGADGSAEQNIALHKAVMAKLAENGGVVPDSLRQ